MFFFEAIAVLIVNITTITITTIRIIPAQILLIL